MLTDLYNLFRKSNASSTPLEDFTTECFAGVLSHHTNVLDTFAEWLRLPKERYKVRTQVRYALENDQNCIVDMVLESAGCICFIEVKVHSKEGWRQLERYSNVLDGIIKKEKFLIYCTKFIDAKTVSGHNFKQFRWTDIATLLSKSYNEIPLVKDFIHYLKVHDMAQDYDLTTNTVITMQHFMKTYTAIEYHIQQAIPAFNSLFPSARLEKENSLNKIGEFDRIGRVAKRITLDKHNYSEILYCIHLTTVKMQTQMWFSNTHPQVHQLRKLVEKHAVLKYWQDENGLGIFMDCKLYPFIEDKNADDKIKEWFYGSFQVFQSFIVENEDVDWDYNVLL